MKEFMKYIKLLGVITGVTLLVSGCTSIRATNNFNGERLALSTGRPVAHINTQISGIYLFNMIPLITGNPDFDTSLNFCLFTDNVKLNKCVGMLTKKSNALGATTVLDMTSHVDSVGYPGFWVLWYKWVEVSGNAVK